MKYIKWQINSSDMIGLEGLSKYIDWASIVDDYNLEGGDISPEDLFTLEDILERYIKTNK
jgi:hypothetical protein